MTSPSSQPTLFGVPAGTEAGDVASGRFGPALAGARFRQRRVRQRVALHMTAAEPAALFDLDAPAELAVSGVPASRFDPAHSDAALAGDGFGWLPRLLASPQSPACESCGHPMCLPAAAPVLWACPACHPGEAA